MSSIEKTITDHVIIACINLSGVLITYLGVSYLVSLLFGVVKQVSSFFVNINHYIY
jgi:hypothetical protein